MSKRIGNAVRRNKVRRRMREAVRLLWPRVEPGWDMVFIARSGIRGKDYDQISGAVQKVLYNAYLLGDEAIDMDQRPACEEY